MDLTAGPSRDYACLDSGGFGRLERFGPYVLDRPCPQAVWPRSRPDRWKEAHAIYVRSSSGGGAWTFKRPLKDRWTVRLEDLAVILKPTGFGHLGIFPEQAPHWSWLRSTAEASATPLNVLNLFSYTGISTLCLLKGGARVTHVDASSGVVAWARENAAASGLDGREVRWLVDDAQKFLRREKKRGGRYDGIVLDPPTFGRGPKGEVFKFEIHIPEVIDLCLGLLSDQPRFVLFTSHTPGMGPPVLANLLSPAQGRIASGHMLIAGEDGTPPLPSGVWARWEP